MSFCVYSLEAESGVFPLNLPLSTSAEAICDVNSLYMKGRRRHPRREQNIKRGPERNRQHFNSLLPEGQTQVKVELVRLLIGVRVWELAEKPAKKRTWRVQLLSSQ